MSGRSWAALARRSDRQRELLFQFLINRPDVSLGLLHIVALVFFDILLLVVGLRRFEKKAIS